MACCVERGGGDFVEITAFTVVCKGILFRPNIRPNYSPEYSAETDTLWLVGWTEHSVLAEYSVILPNIQQLCLMFGLILGQTFRQNHAFLAETAYFCRNGRIFGIKRIFSRIRRFGNFGAPNIRIRPKPEMAVSFTHYTLMNIIRKCMWRRWIWCIRKGWRNT